MGPVNSLLMSMFHIHLVDAKYSWFIGYTQNPKLGLCGYVNTKKYSYFVFYTELADNKYLVNITRLKSIYVLIYIISMVHSF